jgi:hypothetical protein
MTFGQVYFRLFEDMSIRRKGWEPGMVVRFSSIGADSLVLHLPNGNRMNYTPPASDLYDKERQEVRNDWEVIK